MRLGFALVALVFGVFSVTFSLAQVVAKADPARAHALAPYDGQITAKLAETLFTQTHMVATDSRAARLAREALRQDPTAVSALATLGLQAQVRGDTAGAHRLFTYAQALSRRHLQTQLWAIEDAVSRGDVAGALHQYDIALRTSDRAPDLLFPVIGSAIEVSDIRNGLVTLFRTPPLWKSGFVDYLAANAKNPKTMALLFADMRRHGEAVPPQAIAATVNALYQGEATDDAWRFYAMFRSNADRRRSRDADFTTAFDPPAVFDWTPVNDVSISTSIQRTARGALFDFVAPPSIGGTLLQQVQLLYPGAYRLTGHSIGVAQAAGALPYWALTCRNGRELGRVVVPNSARSGGTFAGNFTVPADCPAQILAFVARPSDDVGGLSGQLDHVLLTPAR